MKSQIKDRLSQMLNRIKNNIDSIHEETTDKENEKAPTFDQLKKSSNASLVKTKTQEETPPIKATNVHETEFPENAEELTQHDKLKNSEHKEQEVTTDDLTKTNKGSLKL